MEERLLKILKRNINAMPLSSGNRITGIYPTAKEITTLIQSEYVEKEFVEWKDTFENMGKHSNGKYSLWLYGTLYWKTLNELQEYWLKEVKGVKQ